MPRLDIVLARNLDLSRRQITRLLRAGRVSLADGSRLDDPRTPIAPAELPLIVHVDHQPVTLHHRNDVLLHKPLGVVTALRDDRHPTAYAYVRELPLGRELRAIGRLDRDTSGLLLWTTDGDWVHKLAHPRYAVPRTYEAALARPQADLPASVDLGGGEVATVVAYEAIEAAAAHPSLAIPPSTRAIGRVTITRGRFHEVRRIFAAVDNEVLALARTRFGPLTLPTDLPAGCHVGIDLREAFRGLAPSVAAHGGERPVRTDHDERE